MRYGNEVPERFVAILLISFLAAETAKGILMDHDS